MPVQGPRNGVGQHLFGGCFSVVVLTLSGYLVAGWAGASACVCGPLFDRRFLGGLRPVLWNVSLVVQIGFRAVMQFSRGGQGFPFELGP